MSPGTHATDTGTLTHTCMRILFACSKLATVEASKSLPPSAMAIMMYSWLEGRPCTGSFSDPWVLSHFFHALHQEQW